MKPIYSRIMSDCDNKFKSSSKLTIKSSTDANTIIVSAVYRIT